MQESWLNTDFPSADSLYLFLCGLALIVIVVLLTRLSRLRRANLSLERALKYEKLRGRCPYLTLQRDDQQYQLRLTNDSYCYAKHIQVHDALLVVDGGFQIQIHLKS